MGGCTPGIAGRCKDGSAERRSGQERLVYRRLQAPAGYKIMPHTHPTAEFITVISGSFNVGIGEKSMKPLRRNYLPVATSCCRLAWRIMPGRAVKP